MQLISNSINKVFVSLHSLTQSFYDVRSFPVSLIFYLLNRTQRVFGSLWREYQTLSQLVFKCIILVYNTA